MIGEALFKDGLLTVRQQDNVQDDVVRITHELVAIRREEYEELLRRLIDLEAALNESV